MLGKNLILPNYEGIRAARGYIGWSQTELAQKVGLNLSSITKIETGQQHPTKEHLEKVAEVFAFEGIRFHPDGGFIKQEKEVIKIFEGVAGYLKVLEDILETCVTDKKEVLFLGSDEKRSNNAVNEMNKKIYKQGIPCKSLVEEDNDFILGPLDDYRQISADFFLSRDATLIYNNKVLLISKEKESTETAKALLIEDEGLFEQFKRYFYRLWKKGKIPQKSSTKQILFK